MHYLFEFAKNIGIFKISTLKFVRIEYLINAMNFDISDVIF